MNSMCVKVPTAQGKTLRMSKEIPVFEKYRKLSNTLGILLRHRLCFLFLKMRCIALIVERFSKRTFLMAVSLKSAPGKFAVCHGKGRNKDNEI